MQSEITPWAKGKLYCTAIRLFELYCNECQVLKWQHKIEIGVTEVWVLRWMCVHIKGNRVKCQNNHQFWSKLCVFVFVLFWAENRWFMCPKLGEVSGKKWMGKETTNLLIICTSSTQNKLCGIRLALDQTWWSFLYLHPK